MKGLKPVARRHRDALTRVGWDRLETLLAAYYRSEGFDVEHVGTGATGARFDGGIDLKLRRGEQFIVVQCKHWTAMKVPHNAVHELLGLMVNHGATGAILATSGEFTKAAIEAAQRLGHVQLVDGDELRAMLGPIRDVGGDPAAAFDVRMGTGRGAGASVAARVGERLLSAAEDRIRYGSGGRGRRDAGRSLAASLAMKLLVTALFVVFMIGVYQLLMRTIQTTLAPPAQPISAPVAPVSTPVVAASAPGSDPAAPPAHAPAQSRQAQERADEAIGVIEDATPEL